MSSAGTTQILTNSKDKSTNAIINIDYAHHEKHAGSDFFVTYSVADLGAATTPNDMMTLTFKTPDTKEYPHFVFRVLGTAGWRVRFIEAGTGGMASATGTLNILNSNRNSLNVSTVKDIAGTAGVVSYDATLATGGTTLWDQYLPGSTGPKAAGDEGEHDEEIILRQNTLYQVSLYGTDNDAGTIRIGWYEHTDKA